MAATTTIILNKRIVLEEWTETYVHLGQETEFKKSSACSFEQLYKNGYSSICEYVKVAAYHNPVKFVKI